MRRRILGSNKIRRKIFGFCMSELITLISGCGVGKSTALKAMIKPLTDVGYDGVTRLVHAETDKEKLETV
jgi:dephospho-CoA kinase